jgi:hypothetical protein
VHFESDAFNTVSGGPDDFGRLNDQTDTFDGTDVRVLRTVNFTFVGTEKVQVIDVHLMAQPVEYRVIRRIDTVGRRQRGARVKKVLVRELRHQHRMGPAHRQSDAARMHPSVWTETVTNSNVACPDGRQRKIRPHPMRKP